MNWDYTKWDNDREDRNMQPPTEDKEWLQKLNEMQREMRESELKRLKEKDKEQE